MDTLQYINMGHQLFSGPHCPIGCDMLHQLSDESTTPPASTQNVHMEETSQTCCPHGTTVVRKRASVQPSTPLGMLNQARVKNTEAPEPAKCSR
jgi:hypothetical protein